MWRGFVSGGGEGPFVVAFDVVLLGPGSIGDKDAVNDGGRGYAFAGGGAEGE